MSNGSNIPNNTSQPNSLKEFFKGHTLNAFDTETTGLDSTNKNFDKRGRIWQVGLAQEGASGVEKHTSPFFITDQNGNQIPTPKMGQKLVTDSLRNSNGRFSEHAFSQGNFNTFIQQYGNDTLSSLDDSLKATLGQLNSSDILILQNMNFENKMMKSSLEQGLISPDVYQDISSRMSTVEVNADGSTNTLLQRPKSVQDHMRLADMIYHTEYLNNLSETTFQEYRENVNKAITAYSAAIEDPIRKGSVVIELQDITKAFLANAADKGHLEKQTATLGLNVDFLSRAILGTPEQHTALQDSEDTLSLFKKLWSMNEEIESGVELSQATKDHLATIKQQQPSEVNRKFLSTVRSVLSDFDQQNFTRIGDNLSWYSPEVRLKEQQLTHDFLHTLPRLSTTQSTIEKDLPSALDNVLKRYDRFSENILDFNRKEYIGNLKEDLLKGSSIKDIFNTVDVDLHNFKPNLSTGSTESNIIARQSNMTASGEGFWDQKTSLFGKEMSVKTKASILGGIGAGLAYMAFTPRPNPLPDHNQNVSEQFYDEQYLGTAFVDFNERNKHYMM